MKESIQNVRNFATLAKAMGHDIYKDLEKLVDLHDEMLVVFNDCLEYFEQRQDADCNQDGYIPNEEMQMVAKIEKALKPEITRGSGDVFKDMGLEQAPFPTLKGKS